MKAVFDTNILIDYLNGINAAAKEIFLYHSKVISIITYIEVMTGAENRGQEKIIRGFLDLFQIVDLSERVASEVIALRKSHRLKIPDAIVYATARVEDCMLVSRNTKDFKPDWPDIRVPYKMQ